MAARLPAQTMVNTEWKVLVIDDDEDDFIIARDMLKDAKGRKFDVHWANTYTAGREKLISNHYHAVLVDYDLGVHSGIELIREANERGFAAPLILFTGRGSYEVDVEAMGAGATLYLTKGEVNPLLLERAIRYAIEIKQRENELVEARETVERELAERKRAEAELRKSEANLRQSEAVLREREAILRRMDARWNAAIESIDVGVIIATEDEQVIYWNPAAREMHGFSRPDEGIEPLAETPITFQLWTPDGSHLLALDEWPMRRIKRGEPVHDLELCIRRPDQGWEKFFSYSGVMVDTTGGERLIFLTCQDLTVKHQVEDALRESEARQRLSLTAARMVAWEYDSATLKVTLSENAEEVLELPRRHENRDREAIQVSLMPAERGHGDGLIHPEDVERHRALVNQAITTGGSYVSVYRQPHPDKDIWLEEHGQAIVDQAGRTVRLVGVIQNITDRKEAEAALRQSEEKYAKSFRSSPAAIAISTLAEGRFTEVNERFTEIFGYSREEMIGHTSVELGLYPNPVERNEILRLLQQEGRFRDYEIRMLNRNGKPIDLLFSGEQVEIDGQDYLLALILDITDRKQAEAALQANAEVLQESQSRLIEFVENIHANYFALDREWRITYVNRYFSKVLGVDRSDMLGKNFWELFPQYLGTDVEPHYRKVMTERVPFHFRRAGIYSKSLFDISLYPTQEGLASFSIDRTDEMRYQQQLESEKSRWQGVVEAIADEVWLCDTQGTISLINLPDRTAMGLEEFKDWPYEKVFEEVEVFTPDGKPRPVDQAPLLRALKGEIMRGEEIMHHRKNGKTRYRQFSAAPTRDEAGHITGSVAIVHDITALKQTEAALRKSEEKFASAFRSSPVAIAISTVKDGRFIEVNDSYMDLFGFRREELIGHTSIELGMFPDPEERKEVIRRFKENNGFRNFELRLLTKTGEPRDVLFSTEGIELEGQACMLSLVVDITERRRTEQALKENEARLHEFMDNTHDNFCAIDREWRITYVNRHLAETVGISPNDVIGKNLWKTFPRYEGTEVGENYQKVMSERTPIHFWHEGIYADRLLEISIYPTQEGVACFSIDRTEELRYQQKLEDESARLDTILQALPVGIWIADANGRIIGKNDQADRVWAGDAPLVGGVDDYHEYQSWDAQSGKKLETEDFPLTRVLETGQTVEAEEHRIRRFDGSEGYILVSAVPVKDRNGRLTGAVAINLDITERKQAEQALQLSEERFYKAFNANPNAQVISRLSDGQIESINEGFEKLFGFHRDAVIGKTSRDLHMFANDADRDEAVRRIRTENHLRDFELAIQTKSGEIRQASLSVEMIPIEGETLMLTVIQDITERKQVEEALRFSEERYRVAVINAPAVYAQTDRELRYQWIYNPHPDFRPQDVIGKRDDELEDSEDMRRLVARKQQVVDSGVGLREELVFHLSDGEHTYDMTIEPLRDPNGQITGVTTAAFDITDLKRVEQALLESEENFRQLADAMPQLVWTAGADGTVDYYNQRYKEYVGIAPVANGHWEWGPVLHPDDLQPTVDTWNHAIETGEMYQIEHRVRMVDGSFCWHLSRGLPFKDQKGNVIRWFGTATNIHAQKEIEEKLRQSNQELEQFAFVASHDLQEPLRKIILFGNSLRSHVCYTTDNQASDYLDRMQNAAERMQIMIKGLLDLSRVKNRGRDFEPVDLNQVAKDVISDLQSQILAVKGQVKIDPLPTIQGDALQMRQLFQNLIGNALKFHKPDVSPDVYVSGKIVKTQNDNIAEIQFTDNGIGFEQQYAEQIFQPFQRLHGRSKYEGTGLGLAICQKIVERHQGTIEVQSTLGEGSNFTIRLPLNLIQ